VRRSHEQWFHFTVQPRYFSAVDEIREPHLYGKPNGSAKNSWQVDAFTGGTPHGSLSDPEVNPLGKLPGSVWTIPTQPLTVPPELGIDHFAAYPMEWPRRIIQGWTPNGVCTVCGEGRRPVSVEVDRIKTGGGGQATQLAAERAAGGKRTAFATTTFGSAGICSITGYACSCPTPTAPTTPACVLDPFGGTGTTALMAKALGRTGISIDLSSDYCRLAEWRCSDLGQLAAALQVERPEPVNPDQLELFG